MFSEMISIFVLAVVALELSAAMPLAVKPDSDEFIKLGNVAQKEYRLPEEFSVNEYTITLKPYLNETVGKEFTFAGGSEMVVTPLVGGLTKITLHAKDLVIDQDKVTVNLVEEGATTPLKVTSISAKPEYDFCIITVETEFIKDKSYRITFAEYTGYIQEEMEGFYRSSYIQNGETKWMATTQFESTGARLVFPCLDEPQYKATFQLNIVRPAGFQPSLSNMPVENIEELSDGLVLENFYKTPVMSSYLLAFIVSEFEAAEETDPTEKNHFGIWARPDANQMGEYAFTTGKKVVEAMGVYTDIDFYSMNDQMKMDQVAIPDFSAGAMENWGLLTYREGYLMWDESESSDKYKQEVSTILAHEIAHQWFGDLVTCHWWSSTWLNEGFATFFEYKIPDLVDQEMDLATQFIPDVMQRALLADTSVLSAPMTYDNINTPEEIDGHFSSISYSKGGSVLRMMEHWLGEETFKKALSAYLTKMSYKPSKPEDLFSSLQDQADTDSALEAYPDSDVQSVMSSWTTQSGFPILQVNINYENKQITIQQERMVAFGEKSDPDVLYQIPITFATASKPNFDEKPSSILKKKIDVIAKDNANHEWVVFNTRQIGYYRVNYDSHTWSILASALQGKSRVDINTLNRAQIVDDVLNLARENYTSYETALDVIDFLSDESDYAPWLSAISGLTVLRKRFGYVQDTLPKLDKHILNLMKTVTTTLGVDEKATDTHLMKRLRAQTLNFACLLGHEGCVDSAVSLFDNLMKGGDPIKPNLREHVYCNALRKGDEKQYNFLWDMFKSSNVINDRLVMLTALGCTKHEESLNAFLGETLKAVSLIRVQDRMTAFNAALNGNNENVDIVWNCFRDNIEDFRTIYDESVPSLISSIIGRMKGTQLQGVYAYLQSESGLLPGEISVGIKAIADSGVIFEWAVYHKNTVDGWLASKYNGAGAIVSSFALIAAMLTLLFNH